MNSNNLSKKEDKDKKITLIFIINGESFPVETNIKAPLKSAVEKALHESENTARPITDWQVKYNGQVLDMNAKVEDLNLPDNAELLLTLKVGEGGAYE